MHHRLRKIRLDRRVRRLGWLNRFRRCERGVQFVAIAIVTQMLMTFYPAGGFQPILPHLTTNNVAATYLADVVGKQGTAILKIPNYQFSFVLPLLPKSITMPAYSTTLTAESGGLVPKRLDAAASLIS